MVVVVRQREGVVRAVVHEAVELVVRLDVERVRERLRLEATLAALAAKKSRLRKLEKRLNGGIGGIGGGGAGSAGVSGGDYKALQAELAGFVNLLGDSAETAAT